MRKTGGDYMTFKTIKKEIEKAAMNPELTLIVKNTEWSGYRVEGNMDILPMYFDDREVEQIRIDYDSDDELIYGFDKLTIVLKPEKEEEL